MTCSIFARQRGSRSSLYRGSLQIEIHNFYSHMLIPIPNKGKYIWLLNIFDDLLSINNPEFENYLGQMYPVEVEIKDTTESNTSASYLDLLLSIGRGRSTSYFHWWQTWWFQFQYHKFSVSEKQYTIFSRLWRLHLTSYTICPGLLLVLMLHSEGDTTFK